MDSNDEMKKVSEAVKRQQLKEFLLTNPGVKLPDTCWCSCHNEQDK